jgi:hypothetical protein
VALASRNKVSLQDLANEIEALGGAAVVLPTT